MPPSNAPRPPNSHPSHLLPPLPPQVHEACDVTDYNFAAALVMYGSYLGLFVYFALEKYLSPQAKGKEGEAGAAKAGTAAAGAAGKRSASVGKFKAT